MNSSIKFSEYKDVVPGCIRKTNPGCPHIAVIPAITCDTVEGVKGLADCFVHVATINTTYYIDDKHRIIIVWAGPVEVDNYDYEENPLKLRSQTCYDFANNRMIYFNKTGQYRIVELTSGE